MGHQIDYVEFGCRTQPKTIQKECDRIAKYRSDCGSTLYKPIRFFGNKVFKNYEEAEAWIDQNDAGWYDNLAVKFKFKTKTSAKTKWLVKIEYHV